jgi:hypothetical protein
MRDVMQGRCARQGRAYARGKAGRMRDARKADALGREGQIRKARQGRCA